MPPGRDDSNGIPQDLYRGLLPVIPPDGVLDKQYGNNAATAASAAGVRALSAQAVAFYFRAPVKAFFRTRVDYLAYARGVHQAQAELLAQASLNDQTTSRLGLTARRAWMWARGTTPGLLTSVIQQHGWGIVPQQILPPLIANVGVGAVLYTSYLQILGLLHEESSRSVRRVFPPPDPAHTFTAGFLAGSMQSVMAAPLDAIQARYDHRDLMSGNGDGRPRSMWSFSAEKLREIGVRGVFAGWGLSFMKDSFGSAVFFSTFEYVKAQSYYKFITWYYGDLNQDTVDILARKRPSPPKLNAAAAEDENTPVIIRPHYAIEPMFLLFAGIGASLAQQLLLHPLTHIQVKHWDHLEDLDAKAAKLRSATNTNPSPNKPVRKWRMLRAYYHAYQESWAQCTAEAASEGKGIVRWLYRGFWLNTIRQVPGTSAGLIIFELVRRKYGGGNEPVRVATNNYEILLD